MALSQNITQKQTQRLVLTQDLRQSIELLPLTNLELYEKIQQELVENPFLEVLDGGETLGGADEIANADGSAISGDAADSGEYVAEEPYQGETSSPDRSNREISLEGESDWWNGERELSSYSQNEAKTDQKQQLLENSPGHKETLQEHLLWQMQLSQAEEPIQRAGAMIISAIDSKGFLSRDLKDLSTETGITVEELQTALTLIYGFEPLGCGARDSVESLYVQARLLRPEDHISSELLKNYRKYLEHFDYEKIAKESGYKIQEIQDAIDFIRTLEPFPGSLFYEDTSDYVVPDIQVVEIGGNLEVLINDDFIPTLRVNEDYKDLMAKKTGIKNEDREYLEARLNSAKWLIKSIQQRKNTLYKISSALVEFQEGFFLEGREHLRPLTLKEISLATDFHESTVSRIITNKYLQSKWGVFRLKYFFSSSIQNAERDGENYSSRIILERIRKLIESEDIENPLTDQEIVEFFKKDNVLIARRTVAKYRKILRIPSFGDRKKMRKYKEK